MSIEQIGALCANTPTLTACDARGLTVRAVAYHRAPEAEGIAERITRHRYDAAGQLISSIDPKLSKQVPETGKAEPQPNWGTAYSLSGRTLRTDSVDAGWRLHWYGAAGQVLQTIDARRTCTRMEYDGLLRPIAILEKMQDDQERCVECFTYGASDMDPQLNLRGRLIRHDDPAGTLTISGYALTGQPLDETRYFLKTSDASNWPNTIEDRNRLLEGTEGHPVHTTCWFHNALGELLIQEDAQNNQQYFTYNIAGQLQTASVKLRDSEENKMVVEARIYNASGQVLQETAGNSVVTKYTYDPKTQQLSSVHTLRPATSDHSPELQHLQYYYDPVGNILGIEDKTPRSKFFDNQEIRATATYTYDTLYQLVKATGREHAGAVQGSAAPTVKIIPHAPDTYVNYTRTYAYDAGGNLTLIKGETGAVPFTQKMTVAKGSNRLASVSGLQTGDNMSLLTFDPNGNPASLSTGQALVWDARNQLCRVTAVNRLNKPDDEENYQYDGSGQRVRKTTRALANGETLAMRSTEVIYLPGLEIRRCYDINNTLSEELHVISVGAAGRAQVRIQHWAKPKRQLEQMPPQDQFRYSLGNHLGSSTLELDQAADILSYEEYYPFGGTAIWAAKSQIEAKYKVVRYSGKEQDATGLYYYGLRYYAPWLGRWLNPDPAGTVDGLNLFGFVRNNPLKYVDDGGTSSKDTALDAFYAVLVVQKNAKKNLKIYGLHESRKTNSTKFNLQAGASIISSAASIPVKIAVKIGTASIPVVSNLSNSAAEKGFKYLQKDMYPDLMSDSDYKHVDFTEKKFFNSAPEKLAKALTFGAEAASEALPISPSEVIHNMERIDKTWKAIEGISDKTMTADYDKIDKLINLVDSKEAAGLEALSQCEEALTGKNLKIPKSKTPKFSKKQSLNREFLIESANKARTYLGELKQNLYNQSVAGRAQRWGAKVAANINANRIHNAHP